MRIKKENNNNCKVMTDQVLPLELIVWWGHPVTKVFQILQFIIGDLVRWKDACNLRIHQIINSCMILLKSYYGRSFVTSWDNTGG